MVPVGDQVLNRELEIGEGRAPHAGRCFDALQAGGKGGRKNLVRDGDVPPVHDIVKESADECFVLRAGHRSLLHWSGQAVGVVVERLRQGGDEPVSLA